MFIAPRDKESHNARAALLWHDMDDNEKHGVRFGLFPYGRMMEAEREGFDGRQLCLALMDCAKRNGGMRA